MKTETKAILALIAHVIAAFGYCVYFWPDLLTAATWYLPTALVTFFLIALIPTTSDQNSGMST